MERAIDGWMEYDTQCTIEGWLMEAWCRATQESDGHGYG